METKDCPHCNKEFILRIQSQKYCSLSCIILAKRKKTREYQKKYYIKKEIINRICLNCREVYKVTNSNKKYCKKCLKKEYMKEYNRRPYVIERAKKYHEDRCIKKEIINRICLYCNNVYNPKSKRRKYCCDGCAKNANRLKVDINNKKIVKEKVSLPLKEHSICEYCKNSYTRKTMLQKYCKGCTKKRQREHSKKRYVKISHDGICIECGDVYNPRNANSKYCSLECQSKALNLRRKEKKSVQTTLNNTMSSAIHKSLGCEKAGRHWEDLVGYTLRELTIHLEKEFTDGMTWMNRGKEGWHIDHICPKSAFCFRTTYDVDFKRCWALGNLQPLWWRDNIEKRYSLLGDKRSLCWFE